MALYLSIWLLILKKLKVVYQLDGRNQINFGVFLSFVGYFRKRENEPPKRTTSLPSIHRSTSIRERRRFLSDHSVRSRHEVDGFATQQFTLRKRSPSSEDTSSKISLGKKKEKVGTIKYTLRKSLIYAKDSKSSSTIASPPSGSATPNSPSDKSSKVSKDPCDYSAARQKMMIERGRAFTFPDLVAPRARTVSERAEEIDLVMPLPHITKKRTWKSCNSITHHSKSSHHWTIVKKNLPHFKKPKVKGNSSEVLSKTRVSDSRNLEVQSCSKDSSPTHIKWLKLQKQIHELNTVHKYQNTSLPHHLVHTRSNSSVIKVEQ